MASADSTSGVVLHHYRPTFLLRLVPLLAVSGIVVVALSIGLPALETTSDPGMLISSLLGVLLGLALPIFGGYMWLTVPAVTTRFVAARGVIEVEQQRPFRRSVEEYRVADVVGIGAMSMGTRAYTLAMTLRDGEKVRLEYSTSSNAAEVNRQATAIRKALGPTTIPI